MYNKKSFFLSFLLVYLISYSQEDLYSSLNVPKELEEAANAIVRLDETSVSLATINEMRIQEKRIITVLNKKGDESIENFIHYDNNVRIKSLQTFVYDASGKQIKKINEKGFTDVSAIPNGTLYSDSRVKFFRYIPVNYPYTIEIIYEYLSKNTAFIPAFRPITHYDVSVQNSTYSLLYSESIDIRKKEKNFIESSQFIKQESIGKIVYEIKNFGAITNEEFSPSLFDIAPVVLFSMNDFVLEGVVGRASDWSDFGKWMYNDLIKVADDLPESTKTYIKDLVKDDSTDIEKAKKIYEYVQGKVRYISVQEGIGGWKPFSASYVDKMGYGDCKALTNYTMSLLKAVGIDSYYTIVYAGKSKRSLEKDFPSIQGNHAFLTIPNGQEMIWLECTSQKLPFGFIGDFTDDRDVLLIKPEGSEIVHTKKYNTQENKQEISAKVWLYDTGTIEVKTNVSSEGIFYGNKYWLESETTRDLDLHYKNRWAYLNNLNLYDFSISNDKANIKLSETISFRVDNYLNKVGNKFLFSANILNRVKQIPENYKNKKHPLIINRGFVFNDILEIKLPVNFKVEFLPNNVKIENKFGSYNYDISINSDKTIIYKREFKLNDGEYSKEDYIAFRSFYKEVLYHDNVKIELVKN